MSYAGKREPLTRQEQRLIIASIVLMIPVLLDSFDIIPLGEWRMAPFLILLIITGGIVGTKDRITLVSHAGRRTAPSHSHEEVA